MATTDFSKITDAVRSALDTRQKTEDTARDDDIADLIPAPKSPAAVWAKFRKSAVVGRRERPETARD